METEKMSSVLDELEKVAFGIASNLPEERREELHHKLLGDELATFIKKTHYINQMFSGLSESARIGIVVDDLFYEVHLTTKSFDSNAEANDYAQLRSEEIQSTK